MNYNISENPQQYMMILGWDSFFQQHFDMAKTSGSIAARIASESKSSYQILSILGELTAVISGKLRYHAVTGINHPAVGDWVVITPHINERKAVIHAVLPRKSKFSRKIAGARTEEQVIAANVDTVFIVCGLDGGRSFNLRRIERYITLSRDSGASPVIILNKTDLCLDVDPYIRNVESIAPAIPIHPISALNHSGLDTLGNYLTAGKTGAFLGSSGAGKSAIINALLGTDRQKTGEVRNGDLSGRHTTTRRELIILPCGSTVIDTPGMRKIQMWAGEDSLKDSFNDIEQLSRNCKFTDCSHISEPGCAVISAVKQGDLDPSRLESYHKLERELSYISARETQSVRFQEKTRWKKISKWAKDIRNNRDRL